jgi:hypothetical protein
VAEAWLPIVEFAGAACAYTDCILPPTMIATKSINIAPKAANVFFDCDNFRNANKGISFIAKVEFRELIVISLVRILVRA